MDEILFEETEISDNNEIQEIQEIVLLDKLVSADDYGQFLGVGLGIGIVIGFLAVSISGVFAVLKAATNIS